VEQQDKYRLWLQEQATHAGCSVLERRVLERNLIERHGFGKISRDLRLSRKQAEEVLVRAYGLLERIPGWRDAAGQFDCEILQAAAGKGDYDERPQDMRGVEPAAASKKLRNSPLIGRDAVRQDCVSAARLAMIAGVASL
jgi:hypothetical protein